ncbi:OsmC family protein [Granulicella cerasi]|uniref:OsmC family protein n=1 Tax=Granulicella cerasi TaxID=741063 RepID=A0ABW1ZDY2_9BACT|nr:OsmC family protein [Granulicella cerasi]
MKLEIQHMGDVQFSISTRGHTIYSDQPEDNRGYDEAMTPPEIFLGGLGACAAYYAVDYLKRNKLPFEGVRVSVEAEKLKNPARLGEILTRVFTPTELSREHREGVEAAVGKCILHNTLTHPPTLRTEISVEK